MSKVNIKVKFSTLSDLNGLGVKLCVSTTQSKAVMVTPTFDPFFRVKGSKLASSVTCDIKNIGKVCVTVVTLSMSSSFFLLLLSSYNRFNSKTISRISTKLGHRNLWGTGYKSYRMKKFCEVK